MSRFELYKDKAGKFRWRFIASNGRIIATSSESYERKIDCNNSINLIKNDSPAAKVDEKK